jgi:hypothetical protein
MNERRFDGIQRYFTGVWALSRRIVDRRAGLIGRLSGIARFTPDSTALDYEETGKLIYGGYEGSAYQSYRWDILDDDRATIRFKDGRLFHELDLSRGEAVVDHLCAADQYRGYFRVSAQNHWISSWQIIGPRKDVTLISLFRRVPDVSVPSAESCDRAFEHRL